MENRHGEKEVKKSNGISTNGYTAHKNGESNNGGCIRDESL